MGSSVTSVVYVMPNGGQLSLTDTATHGAAASAPVNACTTELPSAWDASRGYQFSSTDNSQIQFLSLNNADILEQAPNSNAYGVATVSGTLVFPSGVKYNVVDSQIRSIEDRNGNEISLTYGGPIVNIDWYLQIRALTQVTDSLGNQTNINYSDSSCGGCLSITYPGAGGAARVVKVNTGSLSSNLRSGYSTTNVAGLFNSSVTGTTYNPTVASSIVLPDGSSYSFQYNPYGELARVVLPTGGAIEYDYAAGDGDSSGGYIAPSGPGGAVMIYRRLTERREYVNGGSGSSSYSSKTDHVVATTTGGITDTVNVYAPGGTQLSQTIHTFSGNPTDVLSMTGTSCNNSLEGVETQTTSGWPSTLLTVTNTYVNGGGSCLNNPQLTTVVTKNEDGQTAQTSYSYDQYNNVSEEKVYDWSSNGGALLRDTSTGYWYQQNTAYSAPGVNLIRLPWVTTIKDGSGNQVAKTVWQYDYYQMASIPQVVGRDSAYSSTNLSSPLRGNLNYVYRTVNSSTQVADSYTYDIAGNVLSHGYDNGTTTYTYNDSFNKYALPITIRDGAYQTTTVTYDYNIGKPSTVTDARGNATSYQYSDPLDRITKITDPISAQTNFGYPAPYWVIMTHSQSSATDQAIQSQVVYDGFGRDIEDRQFTDSTHLVAVDHVYDALGRLTSQSNPSQIYINNWSNDGLAFLTTYVYDSLNRPTQVTDQNGKVTSYTYNGNWTVTTDPVSVSTRVVTDSLGRVSQFLEDYNFGNGGANLPTYYSYDPLGDLTAVFKCADSGCSSGQSRNFSYDQLGRLTQATNPESGTVTYSYGSMQTLQSRTDNRGSSTGLTTYSYDGDNRLTQVTYSDGTPTQHYFYDAVGNLTSAISGTVSGSTLTSGIANNVTYDANNRPSTSSVQFLQGSSSYTYSFTYGYDLAGDLTSETYPSGRSVSTSYDIAMRPLTLSGTPGGGGTTNYVTAMAYWPHGAPNSWTYGNGVVPVDNYSHSLQKVESLSTIGNNPSYYMFYSGNTWNNDNTVGRGLECYGQTVPWANMTCPTQNYTYDHMKRLTGVNDTYYSRGFQYDVYGNMSLSSNSGVTLSGLTPQANQNPYNAANNRLIAASYGDGRGNITAMGAVNAILYDGEGRQIYINDTGTGQSIGYVYDGMGQRMQRQFANGATTFYIHDAFGNLAAEYNSQGVTPDCTTCYLSYDEVGSLRMVTDENAGIIARHDYLPFGEEILNGQAGRTASFGFGNSAAITQMFTGQERDGGTATLDYFNARHFSAVLGSMMQPDPGNAGGDIMNPQSWNGYGYVLGNPLGLVDPSGMASQDCYNCVTVDGGSGPLVGTWSWWMNGGWRSLIPSLFGGSGGSSGGGGGDPVYTATGLGKADIPTISFSLFNSLSTPAKNGTQTCSGTATFRGVGGNEAPDLGALFSFYPKASGGSIRGGVNGTVAVKRNFLGLTTRQLRTWGTQIQVLPSIQGIIKQFSGPTGPLTVSDYGDTNIQATRGVAFDIYRFPTTADSDGFGKHTATTTVTFPLASGGTCPPGWTVIP